MFVVLAVCFAGMYPAIRNFGLGGLFLIFIRNSVLYYMHLYRHFIFDYFEYWCLFLMIHLLDFYIQLVDILLCFVLSALVSQYPITPHNTERGYYYICTTGWRQTRYSAFHAKHVEVAVLVSISPSVEVQYVDQQRRIHG